MRAAVLLLVPLVGCADWTALAANARCKQLGAACDAGTPLATGRWPDSATGFCTDGTAELVPCPSPGQAFYGQDATYLLSVPTYQGEGDVVHDSVTGLTWEDQSSSSTDTRDDAALRCTNLQTGGRSWRLPTRLELATLLDFGGGRTFSGLASDRHWTASTPADTARGWVINFLDDVVSDFGATTRLFVICVSGPELSGTRTTAGETVNDSLTGLTWQRTPDTRGSTWQAALGLCEGLDLEGHVDWRLPSAKELLTIVQDSQEPVPEFDTNTAGARLWSSSPNPHNLNHVINVDLPLGELGSDIATSRFDVRCVRGPDPL